MDDDVTQLDCMDAIDEELTAIETSLGVGVKGDHASVSARFDDLGAPVTWTPTINAGMTTGNGTWFARYTVIGQQVTATIRYIQGSAGGVTGDVQLHAPIGPISSAHSTIFGVGWAQTNGNRYLVHAGNLGSSAVLLVRLVSTAGAVATVGSAALNSQAAWVAGDSFGFTVTYICA
jgi:hypothetical protein